MFWSNSPTSVQILVWEQHLFQTSRLAAPACQAANIVCIKESGQFASSSENSLYDLPLTLPDWE
jgi:hypothetical protein